MFSVLIISGNLSRPGGAGYVDAYVLKAFYDLGFKPLLVLFGKRIHEQHYSKIMGIKFELFKINTRINDILPPINIHKHYLCKIIEKYKPDIIWTNSLYKDLIDLAYKHNIKIIVYYHMIIPWYLQIRGYYRKYSWSDLSMMALALKLANIKMSTYDLTPVNYADIVIVNSTYMKYLSKIYWNFEPYVLPPPIETHKYTTRHYNERSKTIICLGRISPEKRFEDVIKAVGSIDHELEVWILGIFHSNKISYVNRLVQLANKLKVRMKLFPNISERHKIHLLSKGLIYVHCARAEHFGISILEAMASAIPVVVHKSGEPYYGIIGRGQYGMYYENINQLSLSIKLLLNRNKWNHYSIKSIQRAKEYDYNVFRNKLKNIIEQLM